jgi:hypothetical protein
MVSLAPVRVIPQQQAMQVVIRHIWQSESIFTLIHDVERRVKRA